MAQWIGNNFGSLSADKSAKNHTVFQPDLSKHGQAYQGLAEANPYSNVSYRQSWIQKVLQNLGFRTNYDSYLEGMSLQAKEYDNALLQKEYDENYNSPLQQAMREQAAGVNPDLAGNVGPGEASQMKDDGNPPVPPQADDVQMVTDFASGALSALQTAFGLYSSVQGITNQFLTNQGKRIENSNLFMQHTDEVIQHVMDKVYENESGPDWRVANNYYNRYKSVLGKQLSRRQFRQFIEQAHVFEQGLSTDEKVWSKRSSRAGSRKSFFKTTSGRDYSEVDTVMEEVAGELSDLERDTLDSELYARERKADNDFQYENDVRPIEIKNAKTYQENINPKLKAETENKLNRNTGELSDLEVKEARYQRRLRKSFDRIMSRLDKLADSGNTFASIAQMALSAILLGMVSGPSFSRTSGPKGVSSSVSW